VSIDLSVINLSGGAVPPMSVSWDAATLTATWSFAADLPDGNYRATLNAAGVADWTGTTLAGPNPVYNFFFLAGDINQDRAVNNADFAILYSNFGQSGKSYADGDLNRDGKVDFTDYQKLGLLFNKALAAPAEPVASAPVEAPVTSAPGRPPSKPAPKKRPPAFSVLRI
jgi:hypothetical protein